MRINQYKTDIKTGKTAGTEVVDYKTTIVSFTDETITLNTGGWWSRSTKIRMNQASQQFDLGYRVYPNRQRLVRRIWRKVTTLHGGTKPHKSDNRRSKSCCINGYGAADMLTSSCAFPRVGIG